MAEHGSPRCAPPATLAALLGPRSRRDFLARHWQHEWLLQRGRRGRFEGLLPWAELNRILGEHRLAAPRLRLYRGGKPVGTAGAAGEDAVLAAAAPLARELRAGATLILDSVDELHPPLRRLAASLERELGVGVQVNAYAGWRATRGFDLHWDDHDVFILQIYGSKQWRVYGTTRAHPLSGDKVPRPPGKPAWSGALRSGDLLYMPRGVWHVAQPRGEPTLHLTVGFHAPTGLDFLEWWLRRARRLETARRDLPNLAADDERRRYADDLWRSVGRLWRPEMLDEYLEEQDNRARVRPNHGLPFTAQAERPSAASNAAAVRWAAPRQPRWRRTAAGAQFRALNREWHFEAAAEPLLRRLADGEAHMAAALIKTRPRGVSASQVRTLLEELLRQGLLTRT